MHSPHRLNSEIALKSAPGLNRLASIFEATLRTAGAVARRGYARWARRRHARATYLALSEIDERTLRDLGLHRSELMSVATEISGGAESTRARSAQSQHELPF